MNKSLAIILFLLLGLLNSSCTVVRTVETLSPVQILSPSETNTLVAVTNTPFVGKENSPTNIPTFINTLSITPTSSKTPTPSPAILPTETPFPTTEAQATIAAFGPLCDRPYGSEISPNGQWIAVACIGTLDNPDTHLRVVSIDHTKDWKIYFGDYAKGSLYDHKDGVLPYRWSKDGRFLYAAASSKASGCCWLGNYVLVVRLNLETGDQVDILNVLGREIWGISFTISTDDRYLIYFSPLSEDKLVIQDLLTWETQEISVEFQDEIDANYVLLSPGLDKIVMALFRYDENEYWFKVDAIGLVDLITGEQKKIISNITPDKPLYPLRWEDADHVLLTTVSNIRGYESSPEPEFWLLNIQTAELTKVENP